MQYRKLGHTGVEVSTQCLGAMMFGAFGNRDHDECGRMIARALDAGINFVDTADMYSAGESEEIVGQAISGRRDTPNGFGPPRRALTASTNQHTGIAIENRQNNRSLARKSSSRCLPSTAEAE